MSLGGRQMADTPRGLALLRDPRLNKSTAYTESEREALGLLGLLPEGIDTEETQIERVHLHLSRKPNDLEKYIYLSQLQDMDETLFFRVLMSDPAQFLPLVYTPTVGEACLQFGHIMRRPKGLYLSIERKGRVREILRKDPLYLGFRRTRPAVEELDEFVEEFVTAVEDEFPNCCIQFEDWAGVDAVRLLARYREQVCCFNDDIQGTAAVALAGILGALRIIGGKLS